jgi:predicted phage terminase large subunit-like protein
VKQRRDLQAAANPDFETLYQQNPTSEASLKLKREHFVSFDRASIPELPIVLSVEPGHRGGEGRSYSVIQAWARSDGNYFLLDQWREQARYRELRDAYWRFVRRHRPVCALIEATANGPALIADVRNRPRVTVIPITPERRSKIARLRDHIQVFRAGKVRLPVKAPWIEEFIAEFLDFPRGEFDDQVDGATQFLKWIRETNPSLELPAPRALGVVSTLSSTSPAVPHIDGVALGCHSWRGLRVRR